MPAGDTIKDISTVREVLRECSVFGDKTREDFVRDPRHELAKIDQWLYRYKHEFRDRENRKHVFLSLDARDVERNPLYVFFKIGRFKDNDIRFHFGLLDILGDGREATLDEIETALGRSGIFDASNDALSFETSILRRKLEEYSRLGILRNRKVGRKYVYALAPDVSLSGWQPAVSFFSETSLLGVIGSFVCDRIARASALARLDSGTGGRDAPLFVFRHHYIHHALDAEIILGVLDAIGRHCMVTFGYLSKNGARIEFLALPLRIYQSVQSGRVHVLAWNARGRCAAVYRADRILDVKAGESVAWFERTKEAADRVMSHIWGVSLKDRQKMQHLEMTVRAHYRGDFVLTRLAQEKRFGNVVRVDEMTARFEIDTYDAMELMPWVRTFIGNIADIQCTDAVFLDTFYVDLRRCFSMYQPEGDVG